MAKANVNPFDIYEIKTKKAVIKALGNAEIEYKEFTMEESDTFQKMVVKGLDDNGKPIPDMDKYVDVKYYKVATALVNPPMTVEQLKKLPKKAAEAIDEILALVEPNGEDLEEGKN